MDAETPPAPRTRAARLVLLDGTERAGHLRAFSPSDPDLFLEEPEERIPASSVAVVHFLRSGPEGEPGRPVPDETPLRVKLASGESHLVVPLDDPADAVGFRAVPLDDAGCEECFYYQHAVAARERDESIGALLVREGRLAEADLQRGLDAQAALRRRRIGEILMERHRLTPEQISTSIALNARRGVRIGDVLVEAGLVTTADVEAALREQRAHRGRRIGEILLEMGVVDERALAQTLGRKFHLPFVDLDECLIDPEAVRAVPRAILEKHQILPLELDEGRLTVALSDPLNTEAIDLIRFRRSERIREVVAVPSQLARYLLALFSGGEANEHAAEVALLLQDLDVEAKTEPVEEEDDASLEVRESDNAIIQLANQIIVEAVRRNASDIHVEPNGGREGVRIRFRIDGECVALPEVPSTHRNALVSRLKIMANLDIAERRKPQDGKIRLRMPDRTVELRVATVPTVTGEDVVLRILAGSKPIPMDTLGLHERNQKELERLVSKPYGLVLCVGPTGSGKSTSLHALLGHINKPERKIWTAEDPVEITQSGLRQVQVRPKIGFGFAEALRAFLRADPDVIMVGEMRDKETAHIAVQASLTGHLVFSTLHTNSAPETVVRLIEMGLDPFSFGDALLGVLAQRLARRLCDGCRTLEPGDEADLEELRAALGADPAAEQVGQLLWRPRGCQACRGTGYRGRIALHELLVVDPELRAAIHARAGAETIREHAVRGGMTTLLQDGARKCLDGSTDLKQVLAVCAR